MIDLFAIATENATAIAEAFAALCADLPPEGLAPLVRYAERVQETGRISINMKQDHLNGFLTSRQHQNTYERAEQTAAETGRPREEILRESLKAFYELRVTFDHSFQDGERFRYGALNIGGMGAITYGEYCVVLQGQVSSGRSQVAYVRADSLKTYMLGPILNETDIRKDATPHAHRHHLATLKHASDVPGCPEDGWPHLLCSSSDCVETIFTGAVSPTDTEVVRMPRPDYDDRMRRALDGSLGTAAEHEKRLLGIFKNVQKELRSNRIPLELVDHVPTTRLGA
ncbi:MAG TPA: hypothetical protein VH988_07785 [Thermoanaerobaculia bacterium]|jgi:hypothetical protein|nr:hypothetical protein [Thermoanaerobaculia bacterium]